MKIQTYNEYVSSWNLLVDCLLLLDSFPVIAQLAGAVEYTEYTSAEG